MLRVVPCSLRFGGLEGFSNDLEFKDVVNIPWVRTSDLILVTWWRNGRNFWRGTAEGCERSGRIGGPSGYLVPVMSSKSESLILRSSRNPVIKPEGNARLG